MTVETTEEESRFWRLTRYGGYSPAAAKLLVPLIDVRVSNARRCLEMCRAETPDDPGRAEIAAVSFYIDAVPRPSWTRRSTLGAITGYVAPATSGRGGGECDAAPAT